MSYDVTVGFSSQKTFVSWLIRVFTGSRWAHSWIEYRSGLWGGRWIAHSTGAGVQKVPAEQLKAVWSSWVGYSCEIDLTPGIRTNRSYVGTGYDFVSLGGHILRLMTWWLLGRRILNPSRDASKVTCSEFVARILKGAGVPGTEEWDPETMDSGALQSFCETSPYFTKVQG